MRNTNKIVFCVLVSLTSFVCFSASVEDKKADSVAATAQNSRMVEARANRMVKSAVALFASNEEDRAISMLEAVQRMYPDSQVRFVAALELGRHFLEKRGFDRAHAELAKAGRSENNDVCAESLLLLGRLHAARGAASESSIALRRLVQDYPTSKFANDAYFLLGQLHFEAGRWARAVEAFEMVGTAVPEDISKTNDVSRVESGQRVYIHVRDKDLTTYDSLGEKSYVEVSSQSGDSERLELTRFGRSEGEFICSVQTTSEASAKNDGLLTIHGTDNIVATYVDANTEKGEVNRRVIANATFVSSASITFLDGAKRQSISGVFVEQPAVVQVRDFDCDVSDKPDTIKIYARSLCREQQKSDSADARSTASDSDVAWIVCAEKEIVLVETGAHTGVFAGRLVPHIVSQEDADKKTKLPADGIIVLPDGKVAVEYRDQKHLNGKKEVVRTAEAFVLVGGSTEPQSMVSHSSIPDIQVKKLLIEARLLCKWGGIFKEVGLQDKADARADEGLAKMAEIFEIASRNTLDRSLVESAYEVRWNLFLVKNKLREAIATCNALVRRYPDTVIADRAFMQIATAHIQEDTSYSRKAAIEVLSQIIRLPSSHLKAEAQYRIGEVREAEVRAMNNATKRDFSAAIAAFRLCAETYPSSSFAGESYKRIIDYDVSIKNYSSAQETLERVFQDYPDAPWLDEMLLKWGIVKYRMGDVPGAKIKFQQLVDEYPGGKSAKMAVEFLKKLSE